jgi:hypothetical protein
MQAGETVLQGFRVTNTVLIEGNVGPTGVSAASAPARCGVANEDDLLVVSLVVSGGRMRGRRDVPHCPSIGGILAS